jgi:CheY-like chemotaxis protein
VIDGQSPVSGAPGLTIFLADDDADMRSLLAVVLRKDGHRVVEICDGGGLLAELAGERVYAAGDRARSLVIADLRMPVRDGLSVMRELRERGNSPRFVLITAFPEEQVRAEALRLGAVAVLDKPFDFDELRRVVRKVREGRA